MSQQSTRGRKLFDLSAIPAKEILRNKAAVCPPISALCEIIDNIFDNYEENGAASDLAISIVVNTHDSPSSISIAENSGGIPHDRLEPLVRLGVPSHSVKGSIGTWGEGFKVAAFSLGSEIDVRTHPPDEDPISVHFQLGWLDSADWSVPVYELKGDNLRPRCTEFLIRHVSRPIEWSDVMRDLSVIYGHKIRDYEQRGRRVRLDFDVDGRRNSLKPRPLASLDLLRHKYSFPPEFSPRVFTSDLEGEYGQVSLRFVVGLTARHSGETSGVYLYGNGRLFAKALRTRAVGYGESGNSILRDHPSCWRIHAYVFIQAEDGRDVPWQAPLKDGVSENHHLTSRIRSVLKDILAPYSRFAKTAKAAELVPYTMEWGELAADEKAEVLFGKDTTDGLDRLRHLPKQIRDFVPPEELESVRYDGVACERLMHDLNRHAAYAASIIRRRDEAGPSLQEDLMRALNPHAFSGNGELKRNEHDSKPRNRLPKVRKVAIELRVLHLDYLKKHYRLEDDREAVSKAVREIVRRYRKKAERTTGRGR